jgi:hypothetical protein
VSQVDYGIRVRTGKWPDESAAVVQDSLDRMVGHNQPPVEDTAESIKERLDKLMIEAEALLKAGAAGSQDACNAASDLANTFGEIEGKITDLHKVEKAPHLEACRKVDTKWFSLRDVAEDFKKRLKRIVVTPWLLKVDAEIKKQQAEEAAARAAAAASGEQQLPLAPAEEPQRARAGTAKRTTALKRNKVAKITDMVKLLTHLKEHEKIVEAATKIANASAKAGIDLPGMEIVEEGSAT